MNRNEFDRYDRNSSRDYQTPRSDRYRHPERNNDYRFDDYGASARGGYGNESYSGTFGNQGNEMGGSRDMNSEHDAYRSSNPYSNRGFSGSRSSNRDYPSQSRSGRGSLYHYESGQDQTDPYMRGGQSGHRTYGYQSDYDSAGSSFNRDDNPSDLYGTDTSRRFQGSSQSRYDFDRERDSYMRGSGGNDRSGRTEGNYMGSSYSRSSESDYGSGNYGSMGSYNSKRSNPTFDDPYDRSSYIRESRREQYPNQTYNRDSENTRIQHPDSHYDYNPNHSFDESKNRNYIASRNRNRSIDRDRDNKFDRF